MHLKVSGDAASLRKLNALISRFAEPPSHDPHQLPEEMIAGSFGTAPKAFPNFLLRDSSARPQLEGGSKVLKTFHRRISPSVTPGMNSPNSGEICCPGKLLNKAVAGMAVFGRRWQQLNGASVLHDEAAARTTATLILLTTDMLDAVARTIVGMVDGNATDARLARARVAEASERLVQHRASLQRLMVKERKKRREIQHHELAHWFLVLGLSTACGTTRREPKTRGRTQFLPLTVRDDDESEGKISQSSSAEASHKEENRRGEEVVNKPFIRDPNQGTCPSVPCADGFGETLFPKRPPRHCRNVFWNFHSLRKAESRQSALAGRSFADELHRVSKEIWRFECFATKTTRQLNSQEESQFRHFNFLGTQSQWKLLNFLGRGGFAEVWEALHAETGEISAAKITTLDHEMGQEEEEFILALTCKEVTLQRQLKHPNIVEMVECFEVSPQQFVAILEFCVDADLDREILRRGPSSEATAANLARQLLGALHYIHTKAQVVHFDIKPHNILLHADTAKISDFGLHQPLVNGKATLDMKNEFNHFGTLSYLPPEHMRAAVNEGISEFDGKFDVWSLGVVCYEMLFGRRPFTVCESNGQSLKNKTALAVIEQMGAGVRFPSHPKVSEGCYSFVRRLLSPVDNRPTAAEALADSFLQ